MILFPKESFSHWKTYNQEPGVIEDVDRLRKLYAKLLSTIAPDEMLPLSMAPTPKVGGTQDGDGESYAVRNFRRGDVNSNTAKPSSSSLSSGLTLTSSTEEEDDDGNLPFRCFTIDDDEEADDEGDTIDFTTPHNPCSAWRTLSAAIIPEDTMRGMISSRSRSSAPLINTRDHINISILGKARLIEAKVVELIRSIGEMVIYGEQRVSLAAQKQEGKKPEGNKSSKTRDNEAVFEYFCDKNVLSLLVDIIKSKPTNNAKQSAMMHPSEMPFSGVVWTARVKAQVLQTISIFISNVSDPKSLYYLLSNNYINEVVASIVPLDQWTEAALDEILPVYINFLKTLALQLAKSPHLYQFFCDQSGSSSPSLPAFPLFFAAVEVATSPLKVAQSDPFIHTTAMNIILNICQLPDEGLSSVIVELYTEQRILLSHLCDDLCEKYETFVELIYESSSASVRVKEYLDPELNTKLSSDIAKLESSLEFINDFLWCTQRSVNYRFCEYLMQFVICRPIMDSLRLLGTGCATGIFEEGKSHNNDRAEAKYQGALLFLSQVFTTIDYVPLLKMIMVALLHPYTPAESQIDEMSHGDNEFVLTPALNAIAQSEFVVVNGNSIDDKDNSNFSKAVMEESTTHFVDSDSDEHDDASDISVAAVENDVRDRILRLLSGAHGDRSFTLAALMLESMLNSKAVDLPVLKMLRMVPSIDRSSEDSDSDSGVECASLDEALSEYFFALRNKSSSTIGAYSSDYAICLSSCFIPHLLEALTEKGTHLDGIDSRLQDSSLIKGIRSAKNYFAADCQRLKALPGVSELYPELMEHEIGRMFTAEDLSDGQNKEYRCDLVALSAPLKKSVSDVVVQKVPCAKPNEMEEVKFGIRALISLKLLSDLVETRIHHLTSIIGPSSSRWIQSMSSLSTNCAAGDEILSIGCLNKQSIVGIDVDVDGRSHFYFTPSLALTDSRDKGFSLSTYAAGPMITEKDQRRLIADQILINATKKAEMILVVDETEILVLKPKPNSDKKGRGTVLCSTMLNNIIAVAADAEWLHIAIRDAEDVGVFMKKGNMALRFDTAEASQKAKECVINSRAQSKTHLSSQIDSLLESCVSNFDHEAH